MGQNGDCVCMRGRIRVSGVSTRTPTDITSGPNHATALTAMLNVRKNVPKQTVSRRVSAHVAGVPRSKKNNGSVMQRCRPCSECTHASSPVKGRRGVRALRKFGGFLYTTRKRARNLIAHLVSCTGLYTFPSQIVSLARLNLQRFAKLSRLIRWTLAVSTIIADRLAQLPCLDGPIPPVMLRAKSPSPNQSVPCVFTAQPAVRNRSATSWRSCGVLSRRIT